jgi:hypothetical protein
VGTEQELLTGWKVISMAEDNPVVHADRLLRLIWPIVPSLRRWLRIWLAVVVVFALISLVEVTRSPGAEVAVTFKATSITAILMALAWLPALAGILVLFGGAFKTPAGEASTPGLLSVLPKLIAVLDTIEPKLDEGTKQRVEGIRREAEWELGSYTRGFQQARADLAAYAREYETLRSSSPPSDERTFRMTTVVAQVRALASQAHFSAEDIRTLFNHDQEGDRIVALGLLQASPYKECFDLAIEAIGKSRSAFEQFHGLRAAEAMLPLLGDAEIERLQKVLEEQRKEYLVPKNQDRWSLYQTIMEKLRRKDSSTQTPR